MPPVYHTAYAALLLTCTAAVIVLVGMRLRSYLGAQRPSRGRALNEWIWTLIPLAVLVALSWRQLR